MSNAPNDFYTANNSGDETENERSIRNTVLKYVSYDGDDDDTLEIIIEISIRRRDTRVDVTVFVYACSFFIIRTERASSKASDVYTFARHKPKRF